MYMFRLAKTLHLPVHVIEQMPARELLEWRAFERIECKEQEDALLIAKGKPPKHYPPLGRHKEQARKQMAAWVNAFAL